MPVAGLIAKRAELTGVINQLHANCINTVLI
jgi:hypothetical protein